MLGLLLKWISTSDPSRRFRIELDLMFWGAQHSRFIRKRFQRRIFYVYNCDISHLADIHPSVCFPHPSGIVIGSQAKVESGSRIYQQVTIGSNFNSDNSMARVKKNTYIGSGAKLIGGIEIGENCRIGANAIVTKSVADYCSIVGNNKVIGTKLTDAEIALP
ncbi:serine acetyltransferase [Vibrio sp. 1075]|uniref:serine acetyltransferase n=1 Tax=Vibrio sp. 1075 TaxID=3074543 RepID=UPI002964700D|nr:serine acetyltransferase [Vibrio sp. 1075]MDW2309526.1 serine acetyltransferase [Vibrio sp. 1075]